MQKLIIFLFICYNQTIFLGEDFSQLRNCSIYDKKCMEFKEECRKIFYSGGFVSNRKIAQCMAIGFSLEGGFGFGKAHSPKKSLTLEQRKLSEWGSIALHYNVWGK